MIVSTPHGMNQFYKLWTDAESGKNDYVPIEVHWSEVQVVMKYGKRNNTKHHSHNLIQSLNVSS